LDTRLNFALQKVHILDPFHEVPYTPGIERMAPVNKRRILIIDDQEAIHDDYRKIICPSSRPRLAALSGVESQLFGDANNDFDAADLYDVDSAFQGRDALALVEKSLSEGRPYAVAFVDIRMPPGWDGIHTVREIWSVDPEILIVLCSAYSDYSWEQIVDQLGRTDRFLILRKPFENVEVRQCAAALTERWMISRADVLTGLLNRRSFEEHLRREWAYSLREEQPLACVILDIDFFKTINDSHGHAVGDQVLIQIAGVLSRHARPGDVVCRYGGEEFCFLLPNTDEAGACAWAEHLRQTVAATSINVESHELCISASLGVASRKGAIFRHHDLVKKADDALRAAKLAGRDRVVRWTELNDAAEHSPRVHRYAAIFQGLHARDIMTTPITSLDENVTVAHAAEIFLSKQINSVPITHADGTIAGVVSERDVMEALGHPQGWNARVSEVMTTRVIHYDPDTPAELIFEFLCRVQLHRVVIVEEGRPVGLLSRGCFVRWIQNYAAAQQPAADSRDSRPELLKTANALKIRASLLSDEIHEEPDKFVLPVVNGVSSIQILIADLLNWARNARPIHSDNDFAGLT
jgi:diguanylate cyclase (GGDEF)-like protein